ncbi:sigma-70 family RNA polymerase sigma factor [Adlercreutzia sp. R7]|uniref:Sigma-70 family RNA polymerase sigma factor n=1 Tax=Adlercreutzia wanghongyangiae TaxID=3111451 RepID=A0ABU6IG43_9ACTN|nr:sigma-70 family RNA polymerase sigma factor [Adlercreutzia sp. R7]
MASQTDMETVYRRHIGTVYRLCYSFLGSAAEAEDAAQAVFLSLVERPRTFNDAEHEKAWLITCVQNRCRDVLRSARVSRRGEMPDEPGDDWSLAAASRLLSLLTGCDQDG